MNALTDALAVIDASDRTTERNQLVAAKCRGLMIGYDARWRDQTMRAEAIEEEFNVPVYNLDGKQLSKSRTFTLAGKMDVRVFSDGRRLIMDHKTTSDDISPDGVYWRQLQVEGQANLYILACQVLGIEVGGAIWDAIKKPLIRPKKLAEADRASIASEPHTYCGFPVDSSSVRWVVEGGKGVTEDAHLFGLRVARLCLDEPEKYYQRQSIFKVESDVLEAAGEVWDIAQDVLTCRRTGRAYRNSGACMAYGRPCEYLGICSGYDTPDSDKWARRACVHSELDTIEGDGRDVLSHSRMKCFQTCRRKHYYRYELGIERVNEEEAEALYFGSLIHKALEAWWGHYKVEDEHGDGD